MTIATFLAPSQCYYHYPLAGMKMWLFVVDSRAPCLALHCKYIQCNFYTFYMCPTVISLYYCCSKYSGINVKLIYSFFTVTSTLDCILGLLYMANTCKVHMCTGISCQNFFHSTIIPPWKVSWVSREADKLKEL